MAAESGILMASVFLPLLLSPLAYFIGKRKGVYLVTWFSFGILVISTILLVIPAITISNENPVYAESYIWSQFGNFGLKLDGLSSQFAIAIYALSAVIAIFSREYMVSKLAGNFYNLSNSTTEKSDGIYSEE
jgi:NADH-quinone oxidoreductase subunit M